MSVNNFKDSVMCRIAFRHVFCHVDDRDIHRDLWRGMCHGLTCGKEGDDFVMSTSEIHDLSFFVLSRLDKNRFASSF